MATIASRILKLRTDLGLNQTELGALANVTKSAVSHWECGDTEPTLEALSALHEGCGVSVDWLRHALGGMFDQPRGGARQDGALAGLSPRSRRLLERLIHQVRRGHLVDEDLDTLLQLANRLTKHATQAAEPTEQ